MEGGRLGLCGTRDLATVARVLEDVEGAGACGRGVGGNGRVRIPREVCRRRRKSAR